MIYDTLEIGAESSLVKTITAEMVEQYAHLLGDLNPVHLDEEFAAKSFFRKRVAHGMLAAGLIGAILGNDLPGPGAIYLNQNLEFKLPVYLGDTLTARVQVVEKQDKHKKLRLHTWIENQNGKAVLDGEASVLCR